MTTYLLIVNEVIMFVLALLSGVLFIVTETMHLTTTQTLLVDIGDTIVALIFLCEFVVRLLLVRERGHYLALHSWEVLAAIPVTLPFTQALRLVRLFRVIRVVIHLREVREEVATRTARLR